ncbi:hypothetical protein [Jannaschia sp. M317]|uniref:hypothetical protein n=1 Tax=Jannaschia sp. M317 TaxID=2867011 RepID=UPI0021A78E1F|nr:hypothetical protein [Jannaschia sp. M317]UWQ17646.1 hypothetical protein K3551_17515 [Jannaschia sp. M317]
MRLMIILTALMLTACGGGGNGPTPRAAPALASGGTCPDPDPVRDGPLVDAIRTGNAAPIQTALARDPADPRALAAQAVLTGRGAADPAQAACFAPYF